MATNAIKKADWRANCDELREALLLQERFVTSLGHKPRAGDCVTLHGWVAVQGRRFEPAAELPNGVRRGVATYCYANSHALVKKSRGRFVYAEGYVYTRRVPFPIAHGWVVDVTTGLAVELTLPEPAMAYIGLAFTPTYSLEVYRTATDNCALIDAWDSGWPLIKMTADEFAAVTLDFFGETFDDCRGKTEQPVQRVPAVVGSHPAPSPLGLG